MIPLILELHLIAIANISTAITKDMVIVGIPVLHLLLNWIFWHVSIIYYLLVYNIPIHLVKYSGKLKNLKAICINDHSIASNAL